MAAKKLFEGGETVTAFTGHAGIVIPETALSIIRGRCREGKRPGHYFAPGCCDHPDYVMQIPVLFEDGTFDVMRAMNIRRAERLSREKTAHLQTLMADLAA
ncbi:MAG: hypothetical protein J7M32_13810 [Deltaproteobacteria bacterium]|nr:hypothetical protein [Deltaproteobacteria bacterium]